MNDPSVQQKLQQVLNSYHGTIEYVGYDTLPFLPGWSHYEALKHDPFLFECHEREYAKYSELRERERKKRDHDGCQADEPCLYSNFICHQRCYDQRGLAHAHK